jgi:hypothetical protein
VSLSWAIKTWAKRLWNGVGGWLLFVLRDTLGRVFGWFWCLWDLTHAFVIGGVNTTFDKVWVGEVVKEGYILICTRDVGAKGGIWVCASELGTYDGKTRIGGRTSIGGILTST